MNIPLDHECFQWNFSGYKDGKNSFYFAYNEEGDFGYFADGGKGFYKWNIKKELLETYLEIREGGWYRISPRPLFCGPIQPPPSKVILKIRQMEARRNHVQYR